MSIKNEIKLLLKIQEVDIKIDGLELKKKDLPKKIEDKKLEIKKIDEEISELKKKSEKIQKERKLLELDIESNSGQIKKLQGKIYEVKTNKEYMALQDEIENIKKSNTLVEEKILSMMFEEDEVKKEINNKLSKKALKEEESIEIEKSCNEELKKVEEMLLKEKQEKGILVENVEKKILNKYEQIRRSKGGVAVAKINKNICRECFMEIRPQLFIEMRNDNELVLCESCFRILYLDSVLTMDKSESKV